jgi:hypothetical protein
MYWSRLKNSGRKLYDRGFYGHLIKGGTTLVGIVLAMHLGEKHVLSYYNENYNLNLKRRPDFSFFSLSNLFSVYVMSGVSDKLERFIEKYEGLELFSSYSQKIFHESIVERMRRFRGGKGGPVLRKFGATCLPFYVYSAMQTNFHVVDEIASRVAPAMPPAHTKVDKKDTGSAATAARLRDILDGKAAE